MSTPVPSDPKTTTAAAMPESAPALEHRLHDFWQKNSRAILIFCVVVLAAIVAKGAYELYGRAQRQTVAADYAAASTPEKLKAFAMSHQGDQLGGVAFLRLADDAYAASNYPQAAQYYQTAADVLQQAALAGRARLGVAISKLQGGQAAEGETMLKTLANDTKQLKPVRAEALYDLASLAVSSGKPEEAAKYLDQLNTVEPAGFWAQRAMVLRASLPVAATPADLSAPAIKLPGNP